MWLRAAQQPFLARNPDASRMLCAASTCRFGQLRGVELGGVEPSLRAPTADGAEAGDALTLNARPDAPVDFAARDDMLASVPKRQAPFIYIPRIATTDDSA
jgi:hypothetical protein